METLMKSDIFFFVSTISLVLIAILVFIALGYVIRFLRDVAYISREVKRESKAIIEDINEIRTNVKEKGFGFSFVKRFFNGFFNKKTKSKKVKGE